VTETKFNTVTKLPTEEVRLEASLDKLIEELKVEHARGNVRDLIVFYYDAEGFPQHAVSKSMTLANYAYAIKLLERRFQAWLEE